MKLIVLTSTFLALHDASSCSSFPNEKECTADFCKWKDEQEVCRECILPDDCKGPGKSVCGDGICIDTCASHTCTGNTANNREKDGEMCLSKSGCTDVQCCSTEGTDSTSSNKGQGTVSVPPELAADEYSMTVNEDSDTSLLKCDCLKVAIKDLAQLEQSTLESRRSKFFLDILTESSGMDKNNDTSSSLLNCTDTATTCQAKISQDENNTLSLSSDQNDEKDAEETMRLYQWQEVEHSVKVSVKSSENNLTDSSQFKQAMRRAIHHTISSQVEVSDDDVHITSITQVNNESQHNDSRRLEQWNSNNLVINYVASVVNRAKNELAEFMRGFHYNKTLLAELSKALKADSSQNYEEIRVYESRQPRFGRRYLRFRDATTTTTTTPPPREQTSTTTMHDPTNTELQVSEENDRIYLYIAIGAGAGVLALCLLALCWRKCPCMRALRHDQMVRDLEKQELNFKRHVAQRPGPLKAQDTTPLRTQDTTLLKTQNSSESWLNEWNKSENAQEQVFVPCSLSRKREARWQTASIAMPISDARAHIKVKQQPSVGDATRITPAECQTPESTPSSTRNVRVRTPWPRDTDKDAVAQRIARQTPKEPEMRFDPSPYAYKREREAFEHDHGLLGDKSCYLCEHNERNGSHTDTLFQGSHRQELSGHGRQCGKTYRH